jgi:V8-like Glu-specific endopeptidase
MIKHSGPINRQKFQIEVNKILKRNKNFMLFSFLILPILTYLPFHFKLFEASIGKSDLNSSVAIVEVGEYSGSAFLISSTKLLTAKHVIEGLDNSKLITVIFEKADPVIKAEAKVSYVPEDETQGSDYAILELTKPIDNLTPILVGSFSNAAIEDEVSIIGYPNSIFSSAKAQITNDNLNESPNLFLMNGGAWPGNSGGPIILKRTGEVVGILIAGFEEKYKGMVVGVKIDALLNDSKAIGKY